MGADSTKTLLNKHDLLSSTDFEETPYFKLGSQMIQGKSPEAIYATEDDATKQLIDRLKKVAEHPAIDISSQPIDKQINLMMNLQDLSKFDRLLDVAGSGDDKAFRKELDNLYKKPAIVDEVVLDIIRKSDLVGAQEIEFKNPSFLEKAKGKISELIDEVKEFLGVGSQKAR